MLIFSLQREITHTCPILYLNIILGLGQRRNVLKVVEVRDLALRKGAVETKGVAAPKKVHVATVRGLENVNYVVDRRKEVEQTMKEEEEADLKITGQLETTEHLRNLK